jgi:hypothetical protein
MLSSLSSLQAGASDEAATCFEKSELLALAEKKQVAWEIRRILAAESLQPKARGHAAVFFKVLGSGPGLDKMFKELRIKVCFWSLQICNKPHLAAGV